MKKNTSGFTIVELVVVIAVIGILAAITIVAYNGIQARSQDARIRSTANQIQKQIIVWAAQNPQVTTDGGSGSTAFTNGTCVGGAGGWFSNQPKWYTCTIEDALIAGGYLQSGTVTALPATNKKWPSGGNGNTALMLYKCGGDPKKMAIMYALNTPDTGEMSAVREACTGSSTGGWGPFDTYGMNGGVVFNI